MKLERCPLFGKCGGCALDFADPDYRAQKEKLLSGVLPDEIIWISDLRRRAEFAFLDGQVGFFARASNDIIEIPKCPLFDDSINSVLADLRNIPFSGAGRVLVTKCDNGIAIDFNSAMQFYPPEIKNLNVARISWNGKIVIEHIVPTVLGHTFLPNGFLQATIESQNIMRDFVAQNAAGKIVDLFCGLGTLTIGLKADGFDTFDSGYVKVRDLFKKPLSVKELAKYDTVVIDPPRGGAKEQCTGIAKIPGKKIIYISCNPGTWMRDKKILESGGYKCERVIAMDQFIGTRHWELMSVFV